MLGVFYGRDFYAHTSQNLSPRSLDWKSGELGFPKMTWCIQKALTPTFSFEVDLRTVTVNSTRGTRPPAALVFQNSAFMQI